MRGKRHHLITCRAAATSKAAAANWNMRGTACSTRRLAVKGIGGGRHLASSRTRKRRHNLRGWTLNSRLLYYGEHFATAYPVFVRSAPKEASLFEASGIRFNRRAHAREYHEAALPCNVSVCTGCTAARARGSPITNAPDKKATIASGRWHGGRPHAGVSRVLAPSSACE
jgi:hypothetical protein